MSFYSALILCHAAPPPQVTCATLGQFVRQIAETGAVAADNHLVCQIKFGERVDRDLLTTDVGEWDKSGLIETLGEYHWDYSEEFTSLAAMATALQALPTSVYRAYLNLG